MISQFWADQLKGCIDDQESLGIYLKGCNECIDIKINGLIQNADATVIEGSVTEGHSIQINIDQIAAIVYYDL